ncbi:MAG: hypothetical protein U9O53_03345 [archaeon]|nr:hypothetical protein [archaeon]
MAARKAYVRILEATIVAVLLVTFLVVATMGARQKEESPSSAKTVYNAFEFLDKSNRLREFAVSDPKNLTRFSDSFELLLPLSYQYSVGYTDHTDYVIPDDMPDNESVYVFSYIVSGYEYRYSPTVFLIYVW